MKQFISGLKAKSICFYCLFFSFTLLTSCKYDDDELMKRIDSIENRLIELEKQCKQININISSLQTIINALNDQDYIVSVSEVTENNMRIGYQIEFKKAGTIIIYHGKNGTDGKDGYVPQIGVKKDKNGIYYWTLDDEWLTDEEGNKIKAVGTDGVDGEDGSDGASGSSGSNGITPQIRINDGRWEVSYNNGATWTDLGSTTGDVIPSPITGVEIKDKYVIFTLDEEKIEVPLYSALSISFDNQEIELETGGTVKVSYTLAGTDNIDNIQVSAIGEGVRTSIDHSNKTLTISADSDFNGGKVLVHATDGSNVVVIELTIKAVVITYIEYTATKQIVPSIDTYLEDRSFYNSETQEGKMAIKGEIEVFDGSNLEGGYGTNSNLNLLSIKIPDGVEEIKGDAFMGCYNLKKVEFPSSLKTIGMFAFGDTSLENELIIPEGVETIENSAFKCDNADSKPNYTKLSLPSSIKKIGSQAFSGSSNNGRNMSVYCYATIPPQINKNSFRGAYDYNDISVFVPSQSVDQYKDASGWSSYTKISAIEE
ncbi:PL29 family lyase N-terminal domain-containing protein [Parabacteroides johnsonii]|uniref:PL29 family lyase N-terminal domain-containing protein n=1 Tax=Parabacteroides johnsonii TaxID=387661 RepID=UPI0024313C50|nr:PL29 family lyase N-terminal domain-containing protein [Parabacteroides johnsonii]